MLRTGSVGRVLAAPSATRPQYVVREDQSFVRDMTTNILNTAMIAKGRAAERRGDARADRGVRFWGKGPT